MEPLKACAILAAVGREDLIPAVMENLTNSPSNTHCVDCVMGSAGEVIDSFRWMRTKEGFNYWSELYKQLNGKS